MTEFDLHPPDLAPAPALWQRRLGTLAWPVIGLLAVLLSCWLLARELNDLSWAQLTRSFANITGWRWMFAILSTFVAYAALAWYDRIGLDHLGFKLPWRFISAVSFTTYALSHNIGMSMVSGAMVRYRAYSTKGLTVADVGVLVAFCSLTFGLGTALLGGVVYILTPKTLAHMLHVPTAVGRMIGLALLGAVILYVLGSLLELKPLRLGRFTVAYPRPAIAFRQLLAGPLELVGAAGIIFSALPSADHASFILVLAVFLTSFSVALLSHAPGGLGVLEVVFVTGMPQAERADVVAALLVFRLLYLIVPFAIGIIAVIVFERSRLVRPIRPPPL